MIVNKKLAISARHLKADLWGTPNRIYETLNQEFNFTLDPCATEDNAKCENYYDIKDNGLEQDWAELGPVFCNPPYSRGNIDNWVRKCYFEHSRGGVIVALLPVSTSAKWFHKYIIGKASIRFYERRVRFVGAPFTAPFSSMLAIWDGKPITVTSIKQTKNQQLLFV